MLSLSNNQWHVCVFANYTIEQVVFNIDLCVEILILRGFKHAFLAKAHFLKHVISQSDVVVNVGIIWNLQLYQKRNVGKGLNFIDHSIILIYVYKVLILLRA
jgi:hypothetical protein